MISRNKFWTVLVAFLYVTSIASAGVLWEENFDSYAIGSDIVGQGGWQVWPDPSSTGAIVSWDGSIDSDNFLAVSGSTDVLYENLNITSGAVTFNVKQYIPSTSAGFSFLILLNQPAATPSWAMQLVFDLDSGIVYDENDYSLGAVSILTDQWAEIRAEIDLDNNWVDLYYENTMVRSGTWAALSDYTTDIPHLTTVDFWGAGADVVYYDDLSVAPEPATLALLAMGSIAMIRRKRIPT